MQTRRGERNTMLVGGATSWEMMLLKQRLKSGGAGRIVNNAVLKGGRVHTKMRLM